MQNPSDTGTQHPTEPHDPHNPWSTEMAQWYTRNYGDHPVITNHRIGWVKDRRPSIGYRLWFRIGR